ncbi:MAG: PBP1A family penicillin-binding protein, partial [Anaerolineae bacterium]|nr:PBP1A family penicillin-binding protein [Anaerolineae bacterium]
MFKRIRGWPRRRKLMIGIGLAAGAAGLAFAVWLLWDLPTIDRLQAGMALPSTRIYDRNHRLIYEILSDSETGGLNTAVPLSEIPMTCRQATIAVEDANFYSHPGVDIEGVLRALWINVQGGEVLAGGSTITQQVARNLLLDPQQRAERSLRRKLREAILALQLQAAYSKDEVLALYLNQSYYGNLAYGIQAAAGAYFGKDAADLSLAECALLAGLLQSPAVYDPLTNLEAAKDRQMVVLDLMAQTGAITAEQAGIARNEPLDFAAAPFPIEAPHFVMAVIKQLEREYGQQLYSGGLEVVTTVDVDWQNAAQAIVQHQLEALNLNPSRPPANAENAALVAMDPFTGQVLAMLGSPDYFDESIDGAVNAALAPRQPGSALKPFTYASAFDPLLDTPMTAATMMLDIETPFITRQLQSYTPANYGLVEHGPVSAREALASSLNIPAVQTLQFTGIGRMISLAANAGLTTLTENSELDLAVTLGGGEVRLLDLTQAFSIFPNGGTRVNPTMILSVQDHAGNMLYEWANQRASTRVIDERVAYLITDILSDDNARIMGFGQNSALNIGRPAAAKTGTTTDFRDNWIVGYTPNLVVGVWVGNADNAPMTDVTGVSGAAPIWNEFMRTVLRGQPELSFPRPDGLTRMEVCAPSGLRPTNDCPQRHVEWFIEGTQPETFDTVWQAFEIDTRTGLLADEHTPPESRVRRVFEILPQEARDWAARSGIPQPPPQVVTRVDAHDDALRLLAPDPYTVFELSPLLPPDSQRIRLTAGAPANTRRISYRLDGVLLGAVDASPWAMWWPLQLGEHTLIAEAVLDDGTTISSDAIPFRVVQDALPE